MGLAPPRSGRRASAVDPLWTRADRERVQLDGTPQHATVVFPQVIGMYGQSTLRADWSGIRFGSQWASALGGSSLSARTTSDLRIQADRTFLNDRVPP
jgi:hypothetical protein